MFENPHLPKLYASLSMLDVVSSELASEHATVIPESVARTLNHEELLFLARQFCVYSRPEATEVLRPNIQTELALMDKIELLRFAGESNSPYLEEMLSKELKSRFEYEPTAVLKIATRIMSAEVRDELDHWFGNEWQESE